MNPVDFLAPTDADGGTVKIADADSVRLLLDAAKARALVAELTGGNADELSLAAAVRRLTQPRPRPASSLGDLVDDLAALRARLDVLRQARDNAQDRLAAALAERDQYRTVLADIETRWHRAGDDEAEDSEIDHWDGDECAGCLASAALNPPGADAALVTS